MSLMLSPVTSFDVVGVRVLQPTGKTYDYRVPEGLPVSEGVIVRVPLGRKEVLGVVWAPGAGEVPAEKLKDIALVADCAPLSEGFRAFIEWVAAYTLSDVGAVLKLAIPVDPFTARTKKANSTFVWASPNPEHGIATLTADQDHASNIMKSKIQSSEYATFLLDGVTGSGKTEVYFEAIAETLRQGRQVLVLQPEISLMPPFAQRFAARFGVPPVFWHSGLTPAQRRLAWRGIWGGNAQVVVGARSALMLPYADLGLIVVDEEHDGAYKQEDGVLYNARDMAVARGHRFGFPVILASATPSLETMVNVWSKKYQAVTLPNRYGDAVMPDVRLIDLCSHPPERQKFLSPVLISALHETLGRQEQALLFLNRRGYAPLTLCRACGHRMMCPRCSAWLVAHRKTGRLQCHHCGYGTAEPSVCPSCSEKGVFVACGPGVERIEEEVKELFPQIRTLVLSSDLADHPAALHQAIEDITQRRVDVVIGTQIVAKGHHFPNLTLVGVVDADLGLAGGDLRAAERTFQLLQQVSGRAGRESRAGQVYLQTYMPQNKVMQALVARDRDRFLALEAEERKVTAMPPYARLVGLVLTGAREAETLDVARTFAREAPHAEGFKVWGPAEAPIFRLRGKVRYRLLVQAARTVDVQRAVAEWVSRVKIPRSVSLKIDIDPQSFL